MSEQKQSFWRYENGILILLSLTYALIFLDRFSITNLFPQIAGDLHLNNTQLGLTMSVVALAWGVSSFVFAYISDALGKRKLMLILTVFAFSLSTFFSGIVTTFIGFLLARAFLGIAEGPAVPLVQSTVMAESTESRKGLNTGIPIATSALLSAAAPLLLVWVAQNYGWRTSMYVITIPGLIIGFLLMKFMREPKVSNAKGETKSKISISDLKVVLKTRNVWISMFIAILSVAGGIATLMTFAPLFLINVGHLKQTEAAGIMTIYGLLSLVGNLYIPWLSDKIGRKKAYLLASFMSFLLPLSLIAFHSSYSLLILSLVVLCGGQATMGLCMFIIPGESVPRRLMATASSLPNFVGEVIGGSIGGIVAGYLGDRFGLTAAMIFASATLCGAFILGLAYKESHVKFAKENLMEDRAS